MRWLVLVVLLVLPGCEGEDCCTGRGTADAAGRDVATPDAPDGVCPGPGRDKIKFSRSESCGNDGGVEWCIPDTNNLVLLESFTGIASSITCAPGGGRAMCNTGGKLLCSYPLSFPGECLTTHGEMTPEVWGDMCTLASFPEIVEIVPTIYPD